MNNSSGLQILKEVPGDAAAAAFNSLYFNGLSDRYAELAEAIAEYDEFRSSLPTEKRWTPTPNSFTLARNITFISVVYGDENWQKLRQLKENIVAAVVA